MPAKTAQACKTGRKVTSRDEIDCKSEALLVSLHVLYGLYNRVTDGRPLLTLTALWASDGLKIRQYVSSLDVKTSQIFFTIYICFHLVKTLLAGSQSISKNFSHDLSADFLSR